MTAHHLDVSFCLLQIGIARVALSLHFSIPVGLFCLLYSSLFYSIFPLAFRLSTPLRCFYLLHSSLLTSPVSIYSVFDTLSLPLRCPYYLLTERTTFPP
jgi:hypothetical protein